MFKFLAFTIIFFVMTNCQMHQSITDTPSNPKIDMPGFLSMSSEVQSYRDTRLISIETFNDYALKEHTIILDTRSKQAYDEVHIKGAIHLNFSDFTDEKLKKVIPSKDTRILIYCNNNLRSKAAALVDKRVELALNIPTFINLYGYGYKNIFELNDYLDANDKRLELVYRDQGVLAADGRK